MNVTIEEVDLALAASWESEEEEAKLADDEDELNAAIDALRPHKTLRSRVYESVRKSFDKRTARAYVDLRYPKEVGR